MRCNTLFIPYSKIHYYYVIIHIQYDSTPRVRLSAACTYSQEKTIPGWTWSTLTYMYNWCWSCEQHCAIYCSSFLSLCTVYLLPYTNLKFSPVNLGRWKWVFPCPGTDPVTNENGISTTGYNYMSRKAEQDLILWKYMQSYFSDAQHLLFT